LPPTSTHLQNEWSKPPKPQKAEQLATKKCNILNVCALHEQSTPIRSFTKTSNMQIKGEKAKDRRVNFSRGWKSLACGLTLRNVSKLQAG